MLRGCAGSDLLWIRYRWWWCSVRVRLANIDTQADLEIRWTLPAHCKTSQSRPSEQWRGHSSCWGGARARTWRVWTWECSRYRTLTRPCVVWIRIKTEYGKVGQGPITAASPKKRRYARLNHSGQRHARKAAESAIIAWSERSWLRGLVQELSWVWLCCNLATRETEEAWQRLQHDCVIFALLSNQIATEARIGETSSKLDHLAKAFRIIRLQSEF